ncbi:MAG: bifunctional 5,10-methylenetetrahydrofolate dehydrogenase/5,10-methenyltetrahydrofolate cyclohydrolase [Candidatus Brocadiales bacterium]
MAAQLIDGEALAKKIKSELTIEVETLRKRGRDPHLLAVQVGENPASQVYIRSQSRACEEIGLRYTLDSLPEDITETGLIGHIQGLNRNPSVTAIILQMPLPEGINARRVQSSIAPEKDVEGMNLASMGQLVYGNAKLAPCTAMAVIELIKSTGVEIKGKEATIVGRSAIVGKPLILLLLDLHATPTVCHTRTKDMTFHTKRADILVVSAGKAGLITGDMIKPGAIVIDVGINRVPEYDAEGRPVLGKTGKQKKKTVGDVDFEGAKEVASYITPVPGGVGPVTTVMLLKNVVEAAKLT